jgi:hypothetical protein
MLHAFERQQHSSMCDYNSSISGGSNACVCSAGSRTRCKCVRCEVGDLPQNHCEWHKHTQAQVRHKRK